MTKTKPTTFKLADLKRLSNDDLRHVTGGVVVRGYDPENKKEIVGG
jgi:hypothetical protein